MNTNTRNTPWRSFNVVELVDSDILRSTMITSPYTSGLKASSPSFWISTWMTALLQKGNRIKTCVKTLCWTLILSLLSEIWIKSKIYPLTVEKFLLDNPYGAAKLALRLSYSCAHQHSFETPHDGKETPSWKAREKRAHWFT